MKRALIAPFILIAAVLTPLPAAAVSTTITVDGASAGRTFDGVGAISGGGGNSRLLFDYPEPQRGQVLDYLFRPGVGAALQILKVEVGADTNSTDGAEASIEHARGVVNCNAGYEFWLMEQAKARNPGIKLAALSWGAPGWVGSTFWTADTIDYLVQWLNCAATHGLTIDYLGGWNERGFDINWYKSLRSTLNSRGFASVKVVGADSDWSIAGDMRRDPAFAAAVDIVGTHYPCGYLSAMTNCPSTSDALATGKQLWASENGSQDVDAGAMPMARAINRGYLDGKMTAFINWPLVASIYPSLFFNTAGLIVANQPWSGWYGIGKQLWATAQTTQFTKPGWKYLDTASGFLGGNRANGSYISYAAPDKSAWSTVFETVDSTAAQTVTLRVAGGLPAGTVHVWSTDLTTTNPMAHTADVAPSAGAYQLTLQPGRVYTVTTTVGQGAGATVSPQRTPLRLPYTDTFDSSATGSLPKYFTDMNGAFEATACISGHSGQCVRQMAANPPVRWTNESYFAPYSLIGDTSWTNYTVSSDILLEQTGTAELIGRARLQNRNDNGLDAYHLRVANTGAWSIQRSDANWTFTSLASGTVAALGTNTWHTVSLGFEGTTITARIDGTQVASISDGTYGSGPAGLGTLGYYGARFDNFAVTPGSSPDLSGTYELAARHSGQRLDASGQGTADGTPIIQWTANGGTNQQWRLTRNADGYYTITGVASGKALEVAHSTGVQGIQLELFTPNGGANQQWQVTPFGQGFVTLQARHSAQFADVNGGSLLTGAPVLQWPMNGNTNQQWQLIRLS